MVHCGAFRELEEALMAVGGDGGEGGADGADRADALVWAVTSLLLAPERGRPRVVVL